MTVQDPPFVNGWNTSDSYSKQKLSNVQFTTGLAKGMEKYPFFKTMSLHPGVVNTYIPKNQKKCHQFQVFFTCYCCCLVQPRAGARASLYLARRPFAELRNGEYYDSDTSVGSMNPLGVDKEHVERLWKVSEDLFKIEFKP